MKAWSVKQQTAFNWHDQIKAFLANLIGATLQAW
jgi:hypothetical protein